MEAIRTLSPQWTTPKPARASRHSWGTRVALLASLYYGAALCGLHVALPPGSVSPIFPASGLALAALCLQGKRLWPGIWLGSFAANLWVCAHMPIHVGVVRATLLSSCIAMGATLQGLAGRAVLKRFVGLHDPTEHVTRLIKFALGGALLACLVSSSIGVTALSAAGMIPWGSYLYFWRTWWLGDTGGVMLLAPLIFVLSQPPPLWLRRRVPEGLALLLSLLCLGILLFSPDSLLARLHYPLNTLYLPLLVWAALRFGRYGVVISVLVMSSIATWGTSRGMGPFAVASMNESLLSLQVFVCVSTIALLVLAAALMERCEAESQVEQARAELEQRVITRTGQLRSANRELTEEVLERKRAELALRQSEAQLHAAIESVPFDFWVTDKQGHRARQNAAAATHRGTLESQIEWTALNARALAGESLMGTQHTTIDGAQRIFEYAITPIRVGDEVIGTTGINMDVTERERHAEQLKTSEETYRSIFQSASDAIFVHDVETGAILDVNDRMSQLFGYTRDEARLTDNGMLSLGEPPYARADALKRIMAAVNGEPQVFEWLARHKNNRLFWVEVSLSRVILGGQPRVLAIVHDISDRKSAADRIREHEEQFRLLVGRMPATLWTANRDLVVTSSIGSGLTSVHAEPNPKRDAALFEIGSRPTDDISLRAQQSALQGEGQTFEFHEASRAFEVRVEPLHDADGQIDGVIGVALDVTERQQVLRERQQAEERLRFVLNRAPIVLFVLDNAGTITLCEGEGLRALALSSGDVVGRSFFDVYREAPGLLDHARAALAGQASVSVDEFHSLNLIWEIFWMPSTGPTGGADGVVGVATNVTERVMAERERDRSLGEERSARMAAEQAVRSRDEFLSIASHELKTPVTALQYGIQGLAKLHGQHGLSHAPPAMVENVLEIIERQGKRLGRLVNVLLDISRIEAGRFELTREEFDLVGLTREVVAQQAEELKRSGSCITVEAAHPLIGRWDRFRLDQVVTNLLTNAIKYGARQPIRIALEGTDETVRLSVSDRGIGIAPDRQAFVFDRFERAVSSRNYSGLGLGLYIARRIVEEHGGTLHVTSQPGAGSSFVMTLPRFLQPVVTHEHEYWGAQ
jgi:PAS domain S-box-containing protein